MTIVEEEASKMVFTNSTTSTVPSLYSLSPYLSSTTNNNRNPSNSQMTQQALASFDRCHFENGPYGRGVACNANGWIVYVVKNGLIRILSQGGGGRSLIRHHQATTVQDVQFHNQSDVLSTVGYDSNTNSSVIYIWRLYVQNNDDTIASDTLLQVDCPNFLVQTILWHPFNPNQFWVVGKTMAVLLETTRLQTVSHPNQTHAVANLDHALTNNAIVIYNHDAPITCMAWQTSHMVVVGCQDGILQVYNLQAGTIPVTIRSKLMRTCPILSETSSGDEAILQLQCWSPTRSSGSSSSNHEFVTLNARSCVTLWTYDSASKDDDKAPHPSQVIDLSTLDDNDNNQYLFHRCQTIELDNDPSKRFLVVSSSTLPQLVVLRLQQLQHDDTTTHKLTYSVLFHARYPVMDMVLQSKLSELPEEQSNSLNVDCRVLALQSCAVQLLTLTSTGLLPPPKQSDAVPVAGTPLSLKYSKPKEESFSVPDAYEDYEVDDIVEEEESVGEIQAPDPSSLPPPPGMTIAPTTKSSNNNNNNLSNNPFANWLGAMAAKEATTPPPPLLTTKNAPLSKSPPPLPQVPPNTPAPTPIQRPQPSPQPSSDVAALPDLPQVGISSLAAVVPETNRSSNNNNTNNHRGADAATAEMVQSFKAVLQEEIRTTVLPSVRQAIRAQALANPPPQPDNDSLNTEALSQLITELHTETTKSVLIPAVESVLAQGLQQFSKHLETSHAKAAAQTNKNHQKLDSISKQLSTMTKLVTELTKEVQDLRAMTNQQQQQQRQPQASPFNGPPRADDRQAITELLNQQRFEEAFTTAVSSANVDLIVFCCRQCDLQVVLGSAVGPQLSQPILLCLMQQLSTVLLSSPDPQLELEWLQEIALCLDPSHTDIQPHVAGVLQQVATHIQTRMQSATENPALRRLLQRMLQVVRGTQVA